MRAKQLCETFGNTARFGHGAPRSAERVLTELIQAPRLSAIKTARQKVADLGAISDDTEGAGITSLGRLCLQLPIASLEVARLVWLRVTWGIAADGVVLASVLSAADPFAFPSPHFIRSEVEDLDPRTPSFR